MSQSISATTNIFRQSVFAASWTSAATSRTTLPACSKHFSTTLQTRTKEHNGKTRGPKRYSKPPNPTKAHTISVGYLLSAKSAPEIHNLLASRAHKYQKKEEKKDDEEYGNSKYRHLRRTMFDVPMPFLPTIRSWAESARANQGQILVDITNPDCLTVKMKEPIGYYEGGPQLILHAESPALAALGDDLYTKLRPELPNVEPKNDKYKTPGTTYMSRDAVHRKFGSVAMVKTLAKTISRESRWALHALLMSEKPKRAVLAKPDVEGGEETVLKKDMNKKQGLEALKAKIQPKVTEEKVVVTGVYIETSDLGEKTLQTYIFKQPDMKKPKLVVVKKAKCARIPVVAADGDSAVAAKSTGSEEAAVDEAIVESPTVEEPALKESAVEDAAVEDIVAEEPAPGETVVEDAVKEESTEGNSK